MSLVNEIFVLKEAQRVFDFTRTLKKSLIEEVVGVEPTDNYAGNIECFDKNSFSNQFHITYGFHDSDLGEYLLGVRESKICFVGFTGERDSCFTVSELRTQFGGCTLIENKIETAKCAQHLTKSINDGTRFDGDIALFGTPFQAEVWSALLKIPKGRVVSYGTIAQMIGKPSASRAVANAIGRNPVSFIVPCHRVVRSSGELGGYRWGTAIKTKIIESELCVNKD